MSKEKVYQEATLKCLGENSNGTRMDVVYEAMDQWAKMQSIAFSDWVQENEYFIPEGYTGYVKRTGQEIRFTANQFIKPEDLFDMFLQHQSQQP